MTTAPVPTPVLAHVVFQTRRFEAMLDWYHQVFGTHVVHQNPAMAFMTFDDEHHRFALLNLDLVAPGGPANRGAVGLNHIAYTLPSAAALMTLYRRLKQVGVVPVWPVHHGTTLSLYYDDPDGNRIEFQVDAMPPGQAALFMHGPDFAANPVGVAYDPDALLARFEAGASEAELLAFSAGEPAPIPPLRH
ncbi:VOC family protein [Sandarakinorhabdus rubra]|uniref:VOC family protein n=1 Tax=Sandarakinorhabdus rubra TaxID=2672568 RepID=UPI0013DC8060|nr:VOC family protein [Sandarakinorhabdus rubra]